MIQIFKAAAADLRNLSHWAILLFELIEVLIEVKVLQSVVRYLKIFPAIAFFIFVT